MQLFSKFRIPLVGTLLTLFSLNVLALGGNPVTSDTPEPSPVVVQGDGWTITQAELDIAGGEKLYEISMALHQARTSSLRLQVTKKLLTLEASKRGVTIGALVKAEVEDRIPKVTENEVQSFINTQGAKATDLDRSKVKAFLIGQHRRDLLDRFVASLIEKHNVRIALPTPPRPPIERTNVDLVDSRTRGPNNAAITIVEFADFGCGYCRKAQSTIKQLEKEYPGQIKLVYKHFAVRDKEGARAAECAAQQDQFWAFHDALFKSSGRTVDDLQGIATNLNMNLTAFSECLSNPPDDVINADYEEGRRIGVKATPYWYINGRELRGAVPLNKFRAIIDDELNISGKVAANP